MSITGKYISDFVEQTTTVAGDAFIFQRAGKYHQIEQSNLFDQIISEIGSSVDEYSDGGEAAGKNRELGNTDAFGLDLITTNTSRLWIAAAGNVGISTQTPLNRFHVNGSTRIQTTSILTGITAAGNFILDGVGTTGIDIMTGDEDSPIIKHKRTSNTHGAAIQFHGGGGNDGISFRTGTATSSSTTLRAHITSLGDFILGYNSSAVTNPARIHIKSKGTTSSSWALKLNDSNDDPLIWVADNNIVGLNRIDATAALDIYTAFNSQADMVLRAENSVGDIFSIRGNSYMALGEDNGTARLLINGSGSPVAFPPTATLHVEGTTKLIGTVRIDGQTSNSAGASASKYLTLNLDNTLYKIALLANA